MHFRYEVNAKARVNALEPRELGPDQSRILMRATMLGNSMAGNLKKLSGMDSLRILWEVTMPLDDITELSDDGGDQNAAPGNSAAASAPGNSAAASAPEEAMRNAFLAAGPRDGEVGAFPAAPEGAEEADQEGGEEEDAENDEVEDAN
eukprot:Skav228631  [mRNA]  locus=scaffold1884:17639:21138:+ [translate_table: standard]